MNRMTSGVFELGSVIKAITFAMAFDYGVTDLNGRDDMINTGSVVAANEDIHGHMLRALREAAPLAARRSSA